MPLTFSNLPSQPSDRDVLARSQGGLHQNPRQDSRFFRSPIWILALLSVTIILMRAHTYFEPIESDLSLYAVIGNELLAGRLLYTDLWDHKPPAIYMTCAGAIWLFGYNRLALFVLGIIAAILTLLGIYKAVKLLVEDNSAALWGAAFWAILCSHVDLEANQPNSEAFINLFLVWGFWALLKMPFHRINWPWPIFTGILVALASFYKPFVFVALLLACLGWIISKRRENGKLQAELCSLGIVWGAVIFSWFALAAYFALQGRFRDFYDANIVFNRTYGGSIQANLRQLLTTSKLFPSGLYPAHLLLALSVFALFVLLFYPRSRGFAPWAGYLISAPLMVALPGKFLPHYYQLWLPTLAIGSGLGLSILITASHPALKWLSRTIPIVVMGFILIDEIPLYFLSAEEWSKTKYGSLFIETEKTGNTLKQLLQGDETFYVWGFDTGLYFTSQKRPPSGVICVSHFAGGPLKQKLFTRMMADLTREKPEAIVIAKHSVEQLRDFPLFANWLKVNYMTFKESDQPMFFIYIRRDGRLARQPTSACRPPLKSDPWQQPLNRDREPLHLAWRFPTFRFMMVALREA
jgi:hypothetical protein